ncbi:MAG TPA: XdhC family protein [Acidimicrobiia bacterium]|jgi:xanthine dehydrogenase accessory factor
MSRPELHERAAALREQRVPFVHARVVRAERPTSARPGDEALVLADGTVEGFVGGTCAESTVRAHGLAVLTSGDTLLLRIAPTADDSGRLDPPGMVTEVNHCLSGGAIEVFLEPVVPAPLVAVHGDTPITRALLAFGPALRYHIVPAAEAAFDTAAAVVVASHGRGEKEVLAGALRAGVPYVGLVASSRRGEAIVASLDVDEELRAGVRTPAGLDLGARTPEEVALSILAEIVATRPGPSGPYHPGAACHHPAGS